jgi:hypothetical protein
MTEPYAPSSDEMDAMANMLRGSRHEDLIRAFGGHVMSTRVEKACVDAYREGASARNAAETGINPHLGGLRKSYFARGWNDRDAELRANAAGAGDST